MGKQSRGKQEKRLNRFPEEMSAGKQTKLSKVCFSIVEWGTYLALLTPFIFIRDYFFPFIVSKTVFFCLVVNIIFIAYILLAVSSPRYRPRFNSLTIAVTVFLGVLVLTSITGVNFQRSFWSTFERMTGLFTFFHLYAFFIVLSSVFRERKYWERILSASILVCSLISLMVLFSADSVTRGGGTLGNSSFYSAYLLFNLFFAMILLVVKAGFWRIIYGSALILFLAGLFFNPLGFTEGAVSSLGIGMTLLLVSFMFFSKIKLLKIASPVVLILMVLLGIFIVDSFHFQESTFDLRDIPDRSRQIVWKMGWQGWQERFWLGWGPENFNIPFTKHFDPELPATGDIWYDRVHNIVLDTGVSSGLIGLLSYLSIFAAAVFGLFRILSKVSERKNLIIPLGMITLLLIYFLQNFWVFDMISSYMVFFLSLAFISFLISSAKEESQELETFKKNAFFPFVAAILIIVSVFAFYFNIQSARASKFILRGISLPLEQSVSFFEKALKIIPMSQFEAPEHFLTKIINSAQQPNQDQELLRQGVKTAEEAMKKSIEKNPLDFRMYLFLGKHYNNLYALTSSENYINLAEESLDKAKELSPRNQQVYWFLAQTRIYQGKQQEAVDYLQKAVDLDPHLAQSHWYLAITYYNLGEYQKSAERIERAGELGYNWENNLAALKQVIEVYKVLEDRETLLFLYEKGVEIAPQESGFWANLTDIYVSLGENEKAKKAAEKLLELEPELAPQIEELLRSLGY